MPGWMSVLQIVFLVMGVLGGINLLRPANNNAVLIFRLAVAGIGLIGSVVILILYLSRSRSAEPDDEDDLDDRPRRRRPPRGDD
jgi:hypothetical protein